MSAGVIATPGSLVNSQFHGFFWDSANSASARTFSNVNFGNPSSDRRITICLVTTCGDQHPTMTAAGETVGRVETVWEGSASGGLQAGQWSLNDFDDAVYSGDIVVTLPRISNGVGIGVWSTRRRSALTNFDMADWWDELSPNGDIELKENGVIYAIGAADGASGVGENYLNEFQTDFDNYYSANDNLNVWGGRLFPTVDSDPFTPNYTNMTGSQWIVALQGHGVE